MNTPAADVGRGGTPLKVLVVTLDTIAPRMAGPAIRAWRIAETLAAEHDVELVTFGRCELSPSSFGARALQAHQFEEVVARFDVVVFQGYLFGAFPWLGTCPQVLVADMYDPFHLETLEVDRYKPLQQRRDSSQNAVAEVNAQLARADFVLCASEKQRDFWLGQLSAVGRLNPDTYDDDPDLHSLLAVVPFGLDGTPPPRGDGAIKGIVPGISQGDKVLIWGGGVYNWFDPLTLVRAVDEARRTVPEVRLYFLGMRHPNPDVPEMRVAFQTRELAAELGLTGTHVFFNEDWVPYEQRHRYLTDADVGVSCHFQHIETAFSFRTRILDYLWAGLPIVSTAGDSFAELVQSKGLGAVVPAEDVNALSSELVRLLSDGEEAAACAARVREVSTQFAWESVLQPLVLFCRNPRRAPDVAAVQARSVGQSLPHHLPPPGRLADVRTALRHFREGGPRRVWGAARARVERRRRLGR